MYTHSVFTASVKFCNQPDLAILKQDKIKTLKKKTMYGYPCHPHVDQR